MTACIAMVALAGSVFGNIPAQPEWKSDYREARQLALEGKKPVAVFIGNGSSGWKGQFDAKLHKLLKDKYVCVYVDTSTTAGKSLAKEFAVSSSGLVISDKTGQTQSFNHSGELSKELLEKALVRYADLEVAQGTESVSQLAPKPVIYQSTCPSCPNYAP
jgi:hypothetical protein